MRVLSLVPSWTETLARAGVELCGRTRFCIHPNSVSSVKAVGGTKNVDLDLVRALSPDLIVLDREENTKPMYDELSRISDVFVSDVRSVGDMPKELCALAKAVGQSDVVADSLLDLAQRFERVLAHGPPKLGDIAQLPGVLHRFDQHGRSASSAVLYTIWKDPWMAVSRDTFIASMLERVGISRERLWPEAADRYPKFELDQVPKGAAILLSSEPYPFARFKNLEFDLENAFPGCPVFLIDGESYSWFGVRALEFLEAVNARSNAASRPD